MDSIKILTNKEEITPIADEIRQLNGTTELMDLNTMTNNLDKANNEINTQAIKLDELKTILAGKAGGGSGGAVETCTVTLTSSSSPYEGYIFLTIDDDGNYKIIRKTNQYVTDAIINNVVCNSMCMVRVEGYPSSSLPDRGVANFIGIEYVDTIMLASYESTFGSYEAVYVITANSGGNARIEVFG